MLYAVLLARFVQCKTGMRAWCERTSGVERWALVGLLGCLRFVLPGRWYVVLVEGGCVVAGDGVASVRKSVVLYLAVGPCWAVSNSAWLYSQMYARCIDCHAGWLACGALPRRGASALCTWYLFIATAAVPSDLLVSAVFLAG